MRLHFAVIAFFLCLNLNAAELDTCAEYESQVAQVLSGDSRTVELSAANSCISQRATESILYGIIEKTNSPSGAAWAIELASGKNPAGVDNSKERKPVPYIFAFVFLVLCFLAIYAAFQNKLEYLVQEGENEEKTFNPFFFVLLFVFVFLPFSETGESIATFLVSATQGIGLYILLLTLSLIVPITTQFFVSTDLESGAPTSTKEEAYSEANAKVNSMFAIKIAERIRKNSTIENNAKVDLNGRIFFNSVQSTLDCYSNVGSYEIANNKLYTPLSVQNRKCYRDLVGGSYVQDFGYVSLVKSEVDYSFWLRHEIEFEKLAELNAQYHCVKGDASRDKSKRNYQCIDYVNNKVKGDKYAEFFTKEINQSVIEAERTNLVRAYLDYENSKFKKLNSDSIKTIAEKLTKEIYLRISASIVTSYFIAASSKPSQELTLQGFKDTQVVFNGFEDLSASNNLYILNKSNTSSQSIFIPENLSEYFVIANKTTVRASKGSSFFPENGKDCLNSFSKCSGLSELSVVDIQKNVAGTLSEALKIYAVLKIFEKAKVHNNQTTAMIRGVVEFICGLMISFLIVTFGLQIFSLTINLFSFAISSILLGINIGVLIIKLLASSVFQNKEDDSATNIKMLVIVYWLKPMIFAITFSLIFLLCIKSLNLIFYAENVGGLDIFNSLLELDFEAIRKFLTLIIAGTLIFIIPAVTSRTLTDWFISTLALSDAMESESEYERAVKENGGKIQRFMLKFL